MLEPDLDEIPRSRRPRIPDEMRDRWRRDALGRSWRSVGALGLLVTLPLAAITGFFSLLAGQLGPDPQLLPVHLGFALAIAANITCLVGATGRWRSARGLAFVIFAVIASGACCLYVMTCCH